MTRSNEKPQESDRPVAVNFIAGTLRVQLKDGREIATPLDWYPTLADATDEQRQNYELSLSGIYWPDLDEDLSVAGMLRGIHAPKSHTAADQTT